ncbi:MAG: hypothetical protein EZS28_022519, partial [Streblomastix strix]
LRRLRSSKDKDRRTEHPLPQLKPFNLVVCPNYLFEVVMWLGFFFTIQTIESFVFLIVVLFRMVINAREKKLRYISQNPEYNRDKNLIFHNLMNHKIVDKSLIRFQERLPEKDHQKQIEAVQILLQKHLELKENKNKNRFKLVMCGGIMKGINTYLNSIKAKIEEYGIKDFVDILENRPGDELRNELMNSIGAMHTMFEEHFGIVIVEFMASGALPIVNPSGGMQDDVYALNLNEQHPIHPVFTAITNED